MDATDQPLMLHAMGIFQWIFQVPLKGGRWHITPQLAVYTTYILPSDGLYNPYHPLQEPEKSIEYLPVASFPCEVFRHFSPNSCR